MVRAPHLQNHRMQPTPEDISAVTPSEPLAPRGRQIKQLLLPEGEWFAVTAHYERGRTRWFISRVLMWALVNAADEVDHICGIEGDGVPGEPDGDRYYVLGGDKSPLGESWANVYASTPPSALNVREFTESASTEMRKGI